MLFNSIEYLLFFIVALIVSWALRDRLPLRALVITAFSYFFYISNNHWLIVLIVASTLIDFIAAGQIESSDNPAKRKTWLLFSLISNLSILGFFKYFTFATQSFVQAAATMGLQLDWADMNIFLPVGISFYTFQSMSYTIDVYRGSIPAERSLVRFACYISYFPQLIAGPIVRASEFLPQTHTRPKLSLSALENGLFKIATGLVKKIIFADFLAQYADVFFNAPAQAGTFDAWLGLYAFCFQIYFDFSGYTDIAIGCATLMGFKLPDNFNAPYASASFSDFWRRWHMTLSRWFRDYLYIPLGGSRSKVYRNLFVTMALCGLWHGAAWTFVVWGAMHGLLLCAERLLGWNKAKNIPVWRSLLVFQAVAFSWIPFRAQELAELDDIFHALFHLPTNTTIITIGMAAAILLMIASILRQHMQSLSPLELFLRFPLPLRGMAYAAIAIALMVFDAAGTKEFIYFQF